MARTVERVELNRGSLSASTRRRGFFFVLIVAFCYRAIPLWQASKYPGSLGVSVREPGLLGPFLGQDRVLQAFLTESWWVGSPVYLFFSALEQSLGLSGEGLLILQALLGIICVGVIYRASVSWLGFSAAVLASLFFTIATTSCMGGVMLLPEFVFAWGSLLFLRHLNSLVRHRESGRCLTTGFALGGLSILGAMGSLWLPFVLVWLPLNSRHFRGRAFLDLSWRIVVGWLLVISPGLVQGAMSHGSFTPPFANVAYDLANGLRSPHVVREVRDDTPLDPSSRHDFQRQRLARLDSSPLQDLGKAWSEAPDPLVNLVRRGRAFLGGTHDDGAFLSSESWAQLGLARLPMLSIAFLAALSWLGGVALLGSLRSFAPLYFGVAVPLLAAVGTGLSPQLWMAGMPFFCLLAGYGCSRVWLGRRSPVTWLLVPIILGLGYLLSRGL